MHFFTEYFSDPDHAWRAVVTIGGIGMAITTLEHLANLRDFRRGGIFDWRILREWYVTRAPRPLARAADLVLDYPGVHWLLALRLAALAVLMALPLRGPVFTAASLALAATTWLMSYRNPFGTDGADQMSSILVTVLALHGLVPDDAFVSRAGLVFLGGQAVFSYLTAGVSKLWAPKWKDGSAIAGIMNTVAYGNRFLAVRLQHTPLLNRLLCWNVTVMESTFPLAVVAGEPALLVYMAWGIGFHAFSAAGMGLNCFLWAFTAAYPAIFFCVGLLGR
jgi:hypothetical protein